jgi:probable phosphoglycerate mutase
VSHKTAEIAVIRHGPTEWSVARRFAGSIDLPLTEAGREATRAARDRIDVGRFDEVISSPLMRARETAEILGAVPRIDERLRERDYGEFEGLTTAEIRERVPGWNVWTDDVPGGEPMGEFTARVDEVVAELRGRESGAVLLVTHAHWMRLFTARWLGLDAEGAALFRASELGLTRLGWERENPVVLTWNCT